VLRFGGLVYPQFLSSDLTFHMHNLARVLSGTWSFPGFLPNGTEVPYPPAAYLVLAPLTAVIPDLSLVLRWAVSLLDAATVFPLVYIIRQIAAASPPQSAIRNPHSAIAVAWASALLPAAFVYFSEGTYSNLFAQATFAFTLAPWVAVLVARAGPGLFPPGKSNPELSLSRRERAGVRADLARPTEQPGEDFALTPTLSRREREHEAARGWVGWLPWLLLVGGCTLTFLGHYGMLIAALGLAGLSVIPPLLTGPGVARQRAGAVLAALAAATVLAFVLYYANWLPEMRGQIAGTLDRGRQGTPLDLAALGSRTARRLAEQWGGALALGAFAGLGTLLAGQTRRVPRRLFAAWIGAALGAGAIFAALDQAVGDSIRYPLLLAPWAALGAGTFWGLLARRGAAGPLFVALLAATAAWHLLTRWVDLVLTHYH
jgi:hypothetical protein